MSSHYNKSEMGRSLAREVRVEYLIGPDQWKTYCHCSKEYLWNSKDGSALKKKRNPEVLGPCRAIDVANGNVIETWEV